ncbi:MAG: RND transporter [Acidimicrobiia bacterium]|nr:RND transporter [Acidimicrobiia bacterium]
MALLDRIPWGILAVLCLGLGLAPFFEEPHLVEKTRLLFTGDLTRPIDMFDLVWHLWPFVLAALKLIRNAKKPAEPTPTV